MQKQGFTLAELLVTLLVIGIVASTTIPALQKSLYKKIFTEKYLKAYSTISQSTKMVMAESGGVLDKAIIGHYDSKMRTAYSKYFKVAKTGLMWNDKPGFYYLHGVIYGWPDQYDDAYSFITTDGMYWGFISLGYDHCGYSHYEITNICGKVIVDLNAYDGPNKMGIDIHEFWVTEQKIWPVTEWASGQEIMHCNINSTITYNGRSCGYFIIKNRNMDYLDGW